MAKTKPKPKTAAAKKPNKKKTKAEAEAEFIGEPTAGVPTEKLKEAADAAKENGLPLDQAPHFANPEALGQMNQGFNPAPGEAGYECPECNGVGFHEKGKGKKLKRTQCGKCKGSGWLPSSEFKVNPELAEQAANDAGAKAATEPAGPLAGTIDATISDIVNRAREAESFDPFTDYKSPDYLARYDAETVRTLNDLQEQAAEQEQSYNDAHAEASRRKKAWEKTLESITETIKERREQRGKPVQPKLFPDPEEAPEPKPSKIDRQAAEGRSKTPDTDKAPDDWTPATGPDGIDAEAAPAVDESWMMVRLDEMKEKDGLPPALFKLLSKEGFETFGEVMLTLKEDGGPKNIRGMKKHISDWDDTVNRFWERWNNEAPTRNALRDRTSGNDGPGGESGSTGPSQDDAGSTAGSQGGKPSDPGAGSAADAGTDAADGDAEEE